MGIVPFDEIDLPVTLYFLRDFSRWIAATMLS